MKTACWLLLFLISASIYAQVTSVNSLTGTITFVAGNYTTVSVVGQSVTIDLNTSTALSKVGDQSNADKYCVDSTGSSSAYVCVTNPVLSAGTSWIAGTIIWFVPGTNNSGGCTLDPDGAGGPLGPVSIKKADGSTDPGADTIIAGEDYRLRYDGSVLRLQQGYASP